MSKLFLPCLLAIIVLSSCAPTIKSIAPEAIEAEAVKQAREEGRQEGYKEALTILKAEADARLEDFMRRYKQELLYLQAVKAGILKPGQVAMAYSPGRVSEDGSSYSAPGFSWKVVSAPMFQSDEISRWWKKDEANFCYFFLASFTSEKDALKALGTIEKPDSVLLSSMPYAEDHGKWAVIGKTSTASCNSITTFYQNRGFNPILVH